MKSGEGQNDNVQDVEQGCDVNVGEGKMMMGCMMVLRLILVRCNVDVRFGDSEMRVIIMAVL